MELSVSIVIRCGMYFGFASILSHEYMKTLDQHLSDLPLVTLRAIAQNQGLVIEAGNRREFRQALVREMLETQHVAHVLQDLSPSVREALQSLFDENNRIAVPAFQRRFGAIRRFGPSQLQKEKPWKTPANVAERLWYLGLITRGFDETPDGLAEFFSIPSDLFHLLPLSLPDSERFAFPPTVAGPRPLGGHQNLSDDHNYEGDLPEVGDDHGEHFLDDLAAILIYLQNNRVWVNSRGEWRDSDLKQLIPQLQTQPLIPDQSLAPGNRLSLLFHCARTAGWLTTIKRRQRLHAEAILPWLEQDRPQQKQVLFDAWRNSSEWNDLCLTPGLHCESGNWHNDPKATRGALLDILAQVQPGEWRNLDALITAIHTQAPDFQRPDGNYDTWYIRDDAGAYLNGFEHWGDVEGRLIRYIWSGPLRWLGLISWEGENENWSLTPSGLAQLDLGSSSSPAPPTPPNLLVTDDFRVTLPPGHRLYDRFRVARFCVWEASSPQYRYRITQRGLRRAAAAGIDPEQILKFLTAASDEQVPNKVSGALAKFSL